MLGRMASSWLRRKCTYFKILKNSKVKTTTNRDKNRKIVILTTNASKLKFENVSYRSRCSRECNMKLFCSIKCGKCRRSVTGAEWRRRGTQPGECCVDWSRFPSAAAIKLAFGSPTAGRQPTALDSPPWSMRARALAADSVTFPRCLLNRNLHPPHTPQYRLIYSQADVGRTLEFNVSFGTF